MKIANLIGYNAVYWSIVYFDNKNSFLIYAFIFLLVFLLHLFFFAKNFKQRELALISSVAILGVVFDLIQQAVHVFQLLGHFYFWLPIIWMAFAITFNFSFSKIFQQKNLTLFFLGALFGPFAYFSAGKFHLLNYSTSVSAILIHTFSWGILMIVFKILREKINENIK